MRILLTGFGPFPGVDDNPSAYLAGAFSGLSPSFAREHEITVKVLSTTYRDCQEWLARAFLGKRYDIVLHLGVHGGANYFHLETLGRNEVGAQLKDADGRSWPHRRIVPRGRQSIAATLPCEKIHAKLRRENLPLRLSDDAGTYLCNFLLYGSLRTLRRLRKNTSAGFLHIPHISERCEGKAANHRPLEMHVRVLTRILEETIRDREMMNVE